jgi:D-3-phosphoglycerate dehydrogenase
VADRARGLHMIVIAYDPFVADATAAEVGVRKVTLDELLASADAITAHVVMTPETKGLIDDAAIAKMKKGVLLVNASRGGVYDEGALERGLKAGKIGGIGLDVFVEEPPGDHPLLKLDGVVVTPHLGASTEEAQERVALEICEQVRDFLATGAVRNAINAAQVAKHVG